MLLERPSAVVHLAAVDLHRSQSDPDSAYETNLYGTYLMAKSAARLEVPFVLLSSAAVFGQCAIEAPDEDGRPCPVSVYGRSKWLAEQVALGEHAGTLVVRTGWVFGGHQGHHRKFVETAIERARRADAIEGTVDHRGSPTYVLDLVDDIRALLLEGVTGVRHVVNEGSASGYELASEIVRLLGSSSALIAVRRDVLEIGGSPRPTSEALSSRWQRLRPWKRALADYVARSTSTRAAPPSR